MVRVSVRQSKTVNGSVNIRVNSGQQTVNGSQSQQLIDPECHSCTLATSRSRNDTAE
ncbi:hypothetical protein HanPSC8_Chr06g0234841 [Helianthus annuus]|nr:hypothetical protein HanPSC8_Chr06g0234841 [Helianthus annuus]